MTSRPTCNGAGLKNIRHDAPQAHGTMRFHLWVLHQPDAIANCLPVSTTRGSGVRFLSLDRKAFIDILDEGEGKQSCAMLPPPDGVLGQCRMDMLKKIAWLRRRQGGTRGGAGPE